MNYKELYKHPEWQKKKLRILERDNWKCQECDEKERMLIVHHKYYKREKKPWEYPDEALITLCEDCHDYEHEELDDEARILIETLKRNGFMSGDFPLLTIAINEKDKNAILKLLKEKDII